MKFWIIVIISFGINLTFVAAKNKVKKVQSLKYDSLQNLALLRYEYAFFTAQNEDEKYDALFEKIKIDLQLKNNAKAIHEMSRIEQLNPVLLQNKLYSKNIAKWLFSAGLYNTCLEKINNDTLSEFTAEISFMKTLCLNQEENYDGLISELRNAAYFMHKDTSILFNELSKFKIKDSQRKSVFMQSILPGLGMLNEGAPIEGLQSFLLNGAFVAVPIILLKQDLFLGAFTYGIFPFSKFYTGGIRHTQFLADQNYIKKKNIIKETNALLLYQFYFKKN